jgi:hypothetical protein
MMTHAEQVDRFDDPWRGHRPAGMLLRRIFSLAHYEMPLSAQVATWLIRLCAAQVLLSMIFFFGFSVYFAASFFRDGAVEATAIVVFVTFIIMLFQWGIVRLQCYAARLCAENSARGIWFIHGLALLAGISLWLTLTDTRKDYLIVVIVSIFTTAALSAAAALMWYPTSPAQFSRRDER